MLGGLTWLMKWRKINGQEKEFPLIKGLGEIET